jgi:hypothetical protein
MYSAMPPRWWSIEGFKPDEDFFNKQPLLWCGGGLRQLPLPVAGHGGVERGWDLSMLSSNGEGRGIYASTELIYTGGFNAVTKFCRHGGEISTSIGEALLRSGHGSSSPFLHEVIRSPWQKGGQWLQIVARRGLPSYWPLLLGGNA